MEEIKFTNYAQWREYCAGQGLEGPYRISGQPHLWQFIRRSRIGTQALFNVKDNCGYCFEQPKIDE